MKKSKSYSLKVTCYVLRVQNGFTILYAVLVAAVLLSIGLSIYNISAKQYLLASSATDSLIALYMADAGIECVLYWDGLEAFATSTGSGRGNVDCNNASNTFDDPVVHSGSTHITTFQITDGDQCAKITVTKSDEASPQPHIKTQIESRGYNYCPGQDNPRTVERALRATYPVFTN